MRAFGLDLRGDADLPFAQGRGPCSGPCTDLVVLGGDEPWGRDWPAGEVELLREDRYADGSVAMSVQRDGAGAVRVKAAGYGEHLVWPAATTVASRPDAEGLPWGWQRLLIAQVLPIAAALRGHEVLHASAVADGSGAAAALIGPSGSGKSTLALALVLEGLTLVTDDVLALSSTGDDAVIAYPGAAMLALHDTERAMADVAESAGLAQRVERGEKAYLAVRGAQASLRLRSVVVLEFGDSAAALSLDVLAPPDPMLLMRHAFAATIRTGERLQTQLLVHAALGRTVPVLRARIPRGADPRATAARLLEKLLVTVSA